MSTGPGLPTPGHATFDELTAGFALDALEPGEEELLLAHLPDCERCQDALIAHHEVAASLSYALPQEPLPSVSAELAEAMAAKPRQLPQDPFAPDEAAGRAALDTVTPAFIPVARRNIFVRNTRRVLVGAGALGIIAAVGLSGYDVHLRSTPSRPSVPSAQAALQAITEQGVTIAHLSYAQSSGSQASGTAVVAPDHHAYLVATGLSATSSKTSYVIWNLDSKAPTALKSFASSGTTSPQVVDLGVAKSTAPQKYAVTLEQTKVSAALPKAPSSIYVLTEDAHSA